MLGRRFWSGGGLKLDKGLSRLRVGKSRDSWSEEKAGTDVGFTHRRGKPRQGGVQKYDYAHRSDKEWHSEGKSNAKKGHRERDRAGFPLRGGGVVEGTGHPSVS